MELRNTFKTSNIDVIYELDDNFVKHLKALVFNHMFKNVDFSFDNYASTVFKNTHDMLCEEYNVDELYCADSNSRANYLTKIFNAVYEWNINMSLDVIEVLFLIAFKYKDDYRFRINNFNECVGLLNRRFKEHNIGYIMNEDSLRIIKNTGEPIVTVIKARKSLKDLNFESALEDYDNALDLYKNGNNKDAIVSIARANESTIKNLLFFKKISYDENATLNDLLDICISANVIPSFLKNQFLAPGIVRNKLAGHGKRIKYTVLDKYVNYAIHTVAANIEYFAASL